VDNEKFQELVLKKLDSMDQRLGNLDNGQQEIKTDVAILKSDMTEVKSDVKELSRKMDVVYEQTAGLTEFRTEANRKLDDIANTVDFLTHKESQTEKEIFVIKKNISLGK